MTPSKTAPRLGTRATLVYVRRLGRYRPVCTCCGEATLYKGATGNQSYSRSKAVVAEVYVDAAVPLGPIGDNPRDRAPAVLEGGVWARRELYDPTHYRALGEPYGPVIHKAVA